MQDGAPTVSALVASRLGGRSDNFKLGLAVEGGGMRGVVSGAMLIALTDLGAHDIFDGYYGTSSGSINLAYFLTGQTWSALAVYYDHLTSDRFVSARRLLSGKPIMDMDYLFGDVMGQGVPIDYDLVLRSGRHLAVGLSNVDDHRAEFVATFANGQDLRDALRAGATLPIIAGGPRAYRGTRYIDGGALYPSPFYVALEDGCTHVLALGTRPWGDQKASLSSWQHALAFQLDRWSPGLGKTYKSVNIASYPERALLRPGEATIRGGAVFHVRAQEGAHQVTRMTRDRALLFDGARAGYSAVVDFVRGGSNAGRIFFSLVNSR